jgi:hypothetical protein
LGLSSEQPMHFCEGKAEFCPLGENVFKIICYSAANRRSQKRSVKSQILTVDVECSLQLVSPRCTFVPQERLYYSTFFFSFRDMMNV